MPPSTDLVRRIDSALSRLAARFEQDRLEAERPAGAVGWGQFLDAKRPHRQLGVYGTSAGLLVLALAGRGNSAVVQGAVNLLDMWWTEQNVDYGRLKFSQTIRLAFLRLCLQPVANDTARRIATEVGARLWRHQADSGAWSDYWVSESVYDATPRALATALACLALSVHERTQDPDPRFAGAISYLDGELLRDSDVDPALRGLVAAAVLACSQGIWDRSREYAVGDIVYASRTSLADHYSYFYEYQYADGNESPWQRDSAYFYTAFVTGIAGFLPGAGAGLRERAYDVLGTVLGHLEKGSDVFRPDRDGRISTVQQAWCALFLSLAKDYCESRASLLGDRLIYGLLRGRALPPWLRIGYPAAVLVLAVGFSAVANVTDSYFVRFVVAIALMVVTTLYGPEAIRRLFRR